MERIRWFSIIRCIGILFVVIYHFFKEYLPGGFIGVDMFLTLSGFLLAAQAVERLRANDAFEYVSFIKRRFNRVFPSLFMMIVLCLPLALLISPDFTAGISRQTAAALSFVTNYYEIINGGSYEAQLLPHLFVHTWFLALEMHIHIIWGLLMAVVFILWTKRGRDGRLAIFVLSTVFAALSFVNMQLLYDAHPGNPSIAYFGSTSRAFPFFIGAMAGTLTGMNVREKLKKRLSSSPLRSLIIFAAIAVIAGLAVIAMNVDFSGAAAYRYGMLAASLLTAALILLLRLAHAFTPAHIEEPALLSVSGDLSYGVYLFHWPLYIVCSNLPFISGNAAAAGSAFAISICISAIVTYWAQPVLQSRKRLPAKAALAVTMAGLMVMSGFTFWRSPEISSLEREIYIAYLKQDSDMLYDLGLIREYGDAERGESHGASIESTSPSDRIDGIESPETTASAQNTPSPLPTSADLEQLPATIQQEPEQEPENTAAEPMQSPSATPPAEPVESSPPPGPLDSAEFEEQMPPSSTADPADLEQLNVTIAPEPEQAPEITTTEPTQAPPDTPAAESVESPSILDTSDSGTPADGILIVGCSVLLGARSALREAIPGNTVDAEGSRQMRQGYEYVMRLQEAGTLPEYVVIALGTNGNENSFGYIDKIIEEIAPGHRLIFVAPYNGQGGERSVTYRTAVYIRTLPALYDFVTVADWSSIIMQNPSAIGTDKIHIGGNAAGIELFVNCVLDALNVAATKPAKQ